MFAHRGYEIDDPGPVSSDTIQPVKYWMASVELVVESLFQLATCSAPRGRPNTYSLMELASDSLARHQAALTDEQPAICVEGGNGEHHLLRAIFEHPLLTLF